MVPFRWWAALAAFVLGAGGAYWWCTRPNPAAQARIARADSILAASAARDSLIAYQVFQIDSLSLAADASAVEAAAARGRARERARQPVRRPQETQADSLRFWADSASKAQLSYEDMAVAAARFEQSYNSEREATLRALATIADLDANRHDLEAEISGLKDDLAKQRGCRGLCPGLVAGVGYTLAGDPALFAGVGVRIDPGAIVRAVF